MQTLNELKKIEAPINFQSDKEKIKKFLLFYEEAGQFKYMNALRVMEGSVSIDLGDLASFDEDGNLANRFAKNAFSYMQLTHKVIDELIYHENEIPFNDDDDLFFFHRISRFKEKFPEKDPLSVFPSFLLRSYTINLIPHFAQILSIRDINSSHIGSLLRVRGIVTKVTQVKPSVSVATYVCESCGSETYQQVNTEAFDMLEECGSEKCRVRNVRGTLCLITRGSKFKKFQSVTIQELSSDVPHGSVPRMLNVECYSSLTDSCRPGEFVVISGIFLPKPYHGFKKLKAGLLNDTYLLAQHISRSFEDSVGFPRSIVPTGFSGELEKPAIPNVEAIPIEKLIESFAPEIYGMRDVKKVLLLMLAGAPEMVREDGMRIRGEINVLLMGDPGIAKSQLLKTVCKISKRGVYTTGKGASGVGLTAAVVKDQLTGETVLEGGALVLSDGGICCIDELDKMGEMDRVAIHEVMEQQSVSVSKAGINTTLNARCAVLGAANPVKGRYDPKRSLEQNVGLPTSLLSRFDVLCILKDDANADDDMRMAAHITALHFEDSVQDDYAALKSYISHSRTIDPSLSVSTKEKLITAYLLARKNPQTTPRYLLGLIRITLALARLRLSRTTSDEDASEAISLMEKMKLPSQDKKEPASLKHAIYNFIVSLAKNVDGQKIVSLTDLWEKSTYDVSKVEDVISDFAASGIWMRNNDELIIFN